MKITDKRHAARVVESGLVVARGNADVRRALQGHEAALQKGRAQGPVPTDPTDIRMMRAGRSGSMRQSIQRTRDPMYYMEHNNSFYDVEDEKGLRDLRKLCRMMYRSHPLVGSAVDIFAKWPLVDAAFRCKDEQLVDFYSTLMFDQLDYEEFMVDIGREYWTVGEAWPLGSFSEELGVWEDEELLNPDDVVVERSPFVREPQFKIRLPETLRDVLRTGQPAHEYQALIRSYPELQRFVGSNDLMPVSNVLLKQLKFKGDTFNLRGVPIMNRGLRAILQEEMLNSAQDAISDRLSTPLILARLGASATDLGTQNPWVPTEAQIDDFEASLDAAFAADFRVLTTHFATRMESVFGRESMPNFDRDFERLSERILQVFGLSKTMLTGAGQGQTYAADALNRDLVTQLLSTYQRYIKRFVRDRMLVVAEAQEHYDFETRNGKRYPVMEEVLVVDPETQKRSIVEQPKLLVPDLHLKVMNVSDEKSMREFYENLRASGVPISIQTRMHSIPVDLDEEMEQAREEQIQMAVENQVTRKETYMRLKAQDLPIPEDLERDFAPKALEPLGGEDGGQDQEQAEEEKRLPQAGRDDPKHPALAPTKEDEAEEAGEVIPLPGNKMLPADIPGRTRPPESDEQRANMPKPASVTVKHEVDGKEVEDTFDRGLVRGPRHVGMRVHRKINPDRPLDEQTG